MSPYNSRYAGGPEDFYQQGGDFDPYTGRLQGGNMVLEFLARLAGQKEQKKQAANEDEDRAFEMIRRELYKKQTEQGIEKGEWEKQNRVKPVDPAVQFVMDRMGSVAQQQHDMRKIEAQGKQARETAQAKPAAKTAKELDSDYLSDIADVKKQYAAFEVGARAERQKAHTALINNRVFSPDTFESDKQEIERQYKETLEAIEAKRNIELESLDDRYSDLPRAKMSSAKRSKTKPAEAPAAPAAPAIKVAGTKKRSEIGENVVKVGPDGKKYTKIDGVIYEVID